MEIALNINLNAQKLEDLNKARKHILLQSLENHFHDVVRSVRVMMIFVLFLIFSCIVSSARVMMIQAKFKRNIEGIGYQISKIEIEDEATNYDQGRSKTRLLTMTRADRRQGY